MKKKNTTKLFNNSNSNYVFNEVITIHEDINFHFEVIKYKNNKKDDYIVNHYLKFN
jgi:hypothetical protein